MIFSSSYLRWLSCLDCDLYSSASVVLRFIEDLVRPASVIVFYDWHAFEREGRPEAFGERTAFSEWPLKSRFQTLVNTEEGPAAFTLRPIRISKRLPPYCFTTAPKRLQFLYGAG